MIHIFVNTEAGAIRRHFTQSSCRLPYIDGFKPETINDAGGSSSHIENLSFHLCFCGVIGHAKRDMVDRTNAPCAGRGRGIHQNIYALSAGSFADSIPSAP
jgi:hypothetical protein